MTIPMSSATVVAKWDIYTQNVPEKKNKKVEILK